MNEIPKIILSPDDKRWGDPEKIAEEEGEHKLIKNIKKEKKQKQQKQFQNMQERNDKGNKKPIIKKVPIITDGQATIKHTNNLIDLSSIELQTEGINKQSVQKEKKIYKPGEYIPTGSIITEIDKDLLPKDYDKKHPVLHHKFLNNVENTNKEKAEVVVSNFLKELAKKHHIKNFLNIGKIKLFLIEDGKTKINLDTLIFQIDNNQKEQITRDIVDFIDDHQDILKQDMNLSSELYQAIFLLNKFANIKDDPDGALLDLDFIDKAIDVLENKTISALATINLHAIIKSQVERLRQDQVKKTLDIFLQQNDLNNDTVTLLQHYHPQVWQEFIETDRFQKKQKELEDLANYLTEEVSIEEILKKANQYGKQLEGLVLPEYQAKSNIGLEFEFSKTGQIAEFDKKEQELLEILQQYPFEGGRLYEDQDQIECTFSDGGLEYNKSLFTNLAQFGKELENNPFFVAYGSLHLNMDCNKSISDSLFKFKKEDRNRLEMRHIIGPILDSRYRHLLNFSNTQKQFQIIDSLYDNYDEETIKEFLESKKDILNQKSFHKVYQDISDLELELLLTLAKEKQDVNLTSLILSGYQQNILPMTQILEMLPEIISEIEGTQENLLAIAEVTKQDRDVGLVLAQKVSSIEGTRENLLAIEEGVKQGLRVGLELAKKITNIEGTPENLLAITEVTKQNWGVGLELAKKVTNENIEQLVKEIQNSNKISVENKLIIFALFDFDIEGTQENLLVIAEVTKQNWRVGLKLAEKVTNIEGTQENLLAIVEVTKQDRDVGLVLAQKVSSIEGTRENLLAIEEGVKQGLWVGLELAKKVTEIENNKNNIDIINNFTNETVKGILQGKIVQE